MLDETYGDQQKIIKNYDFECEMKNLEEMEEMLNVAQQIIWDRLNGSIQKVFLSTLGEVMESAPFLCLLRSCS